MVTEKRTAAEKLAVAGAATAQLERAEANLRSVEERARTLRAELADLDEQVAATERAVTEARAQRDRDAAARRHRGDGRGDRKGRAGIRSGQRRAAGGCRRRQGRRCRKRQKFSDSVEAVRREVLAAAELLCWELRSAAMRTRVGNANEAQVAPEPVPAPAPETERQLIYTLNPLSWREGGELRSVAAFTVVGLPKPLLAVALRHQHVDYINARRVQTLMHVHGNGQGAAMPLRATCRRSISMCSPRPSRRAPAPTWREGVDPHGEEARQRRLEPCGPWPSFETPLRGSSG